jgi:hypothetical protein
MAGRIKIRLSKNWKKLDKKLLNSREDLKNHLTRATKLIGKKGEALARKEITEGKYEPNKPLTVALKGGKNEPLIGDRPGAPLFKAITSKVVEELAVFIGILQTNKEYNIARAIHDGTSIKVTKKMRNLFYVLWLKGQRPSIELTGRAAELWDKMPGGWLPLKKSTEAIVIPSRPFIGNVWDKGDIQDYAKRIWDEALAYIFKEIANEN